jgi:hypothetical protein
MLGLATLIALVSKMIDDGGGGEPDLEISSRGRTEAQQCLSRRQLSECY